MCFIFSLFQAEAEIAAVCLAVIVAVILFAGGLIYRYNLNELSLTATSNCTSGRVATATDMTCTPRFRLAVRL